MILGKLFSLSDSWFPHKYIRGIVIVLLPRAVVRASGIIKWCSEPGTYQAILFMPQTIKNRLTQAGDRGSIPGWERSPVGECGYPLPYSSLGKPVDREAWRAQSIGLDRFRHWLKGLRTAQHVVNKYHHSCYSDSPKNVKNQSCRGNQAPKGLLTIKGR